MDVFWLALRRHQVLDGDTRRRMPLAGSICDPWHHLWRRARLTRWSLANLREGRHSVLLLQLVLTLPIVHRQDIIVVRLVRRPAQLACETGIIGPSTSHLHGDCLLVRVVKATFVEVGADDRRLRPLRLDGVSLLVELVGGLRLDGHHLLQLLCQLLAERQRPVRQWLPWVLEMLLKFAVLREEWIVLLFLLRQVFEDETVDFELGLDFCDAMVKATNVALDPVLLLDLFGRRLPAVPEVAERRLDLLPDFVGDQDFGDVVKVGRLIIL